MRTLTILLLLFTLMACTSEPLYRDITLDEFILEDGFEIELVAAEPLLDSPMAFCFADDGRIWASEMPGYMRDLDGSDEYRPDGRIVILDDTDDDGQMDERTVFLDSLVLPRSLLLAYGGLLYVETPRLYWVPIEGDRPGTPELVDSLYVRGGNIEHQPNGLLYHLDNWIYSAKSQHRYQRRNGEWIKEATTFRGQWGITHDDQGRLFYNHNSATLPGDHVPPNVLHRNPYLAVSEGYQQTICPDRRVYPWQATSVNRGYQEGVLDTLTQKLRHFTSACGPHLYRGAQFPSGYYGNAFVCGPEANLIKRVVLTEDHGRVVGSQPYTDREFLVSTDETFRPINLYTGPDGALYVLDLRKGVIQHRAYMTRYLREQILNKGLQTVNGRGRLYKITHAQQAVVPVALPSTPQDWVTALTDRNAWLRLRAQQWLVNHRQQAPLDALRATARQDTHTLAAIHALWTLEGLDRLTPALLAEVGQDAPAEVLAQVLRWADQLDRESLKRLLPPPAAVGEGLLLPAAAYAVGVLAAQGEMAESWVERIADDDLLQEAFIAGARGEEAMVSSQVRAGSPLASRLQEVIAHRRAGQLQAPEVQTDPIVDSRNRAARLYALHCGSCHGQDGKGLTGLAPPLYQSDYIAGDPRTMTRISLQGMQGPLEVNGQTYNFTAPMPGYKDNPDLTDADLAAILSFIRNGFGTDPSPVSAKVVSEMRAELRERTAPFTAAELR